MVDTFITLATVTLSHEVIEMQPKLKTDAEAWTLVLPPEKRDEVLTDLGELLLADADEVNPGRWYLAGNGDSLRLFARVTRADGGTRTITLAELVLNDSKQLLMRINKHPGPINPNKLLEVGLSHCYTIS
ncbi:hypothetical protein DRJ48_03595 [Candidatus Woesearchaeota archaeon]|nr:MAG: hypothetical protein DRJ48_03595 [Candidatus Woesearchaeota archaeon]